MTGRLLLKRDPYDLDIPAVLDACAETGVAIELNANSRRLDIDWRHLRAAKERGVMIVVTADAHSTGQLDYVENGVSMCRKAMYRPDDVLNRLDADGFLAAIRRTGRS